MRQKFTNGKHPYKGKENGSGKRKMSKLYKWMKIDKKEMIKAFLGIEKEISYEPYLGTNK